MDVMMSVLFYLMLLIVQFIDASETKGSDLKRFIAKLPPDYTYGLLKVPENWNKPDGKLIDIFFYGRIKGKGIYSQETPTVFFNGGPSKDSHSLYENIENSQVGHDLPIIFIDQRGTGFSSSYPSSPKKVFDFYGSEGIVRDAEAVRNKLLGDENWNVFGQSYGGLIVYRYLKLFPNSIRKAIADGFALHSHPEENLLNFKAQYKIDLILNFFKKYPLNVARVKKIKNQINGKLSTGIYSSDECIDLILTIGIQDVSSWILVDDFLSKVAPESEHSINFAYFQNFINTNFKKIIERKTFLLSSASTIIHYSEIGDNYTIFAEKYLPSLLSRIAELKEELPIFVLSDELRLREDTSKLKGLVFLKNQIFINDISNALMKNPSLELYVFSGISDVYIPPQSYEEMKNKLSSENRVKFVNREGDHFNYVDDLLVLKNNQKDSKKKTTLDYCRRFYF